jgi:hypothetical protein
MQLIFQLFIVLQEGVAVQEELLEGVVVLVVTTYK